MQTLSKLIVSLTLLIVVQAVEAGKIIYPWRATTALVKAGESIEVWFDADQEQAVHSTYLRGPYNTVHTVIETETGSWIYDLVSGNRYNTKIMVTVPTDAPSERYDLVLKTSTQDEVSLSAVKVVKEIKSEYFIMHFSDTHTYQKGATAVPYKGSVLADIANIMDPLILFVTGDNMYNVNDENVDKYMNGIPSNGLKGIHDFHAATYMVAGNHDAPGNNAGSQNPADIAKFWNRYFGLHTYHFSYGEGRFIGFNDVWSNKRNQEDVNHITWLHRLGMGSIRIAACHKVLEPTLIADLQREADLTAVLGGHNHHKAPINPHLVNNKPVAYVANAMREYFKFNLYRVDNCKGTFEPMGIKNSDASTPGAGMSTGILEAIANPADHESPAKYQPNLSIRFLRENDGQAIQNTAFIDNKFNFTIPDARVRFVMPKGNYQVSQGTIEQVINTDKLSVCDVRLDVEALGVTSVDIMEGSTETIQ